LSCARFWDVKTEAGELELQPSLAEGQLASVIRRLLRLLLLCVAKGCQQAPHLTLLAAFHMLQPS
jgi:hypothetical protein